MWRGGTSAGRGRLKRCVYPRAEDNDGITRNMFKSGNWRQNPLPTRRRLVAGCFQMKEFHPSGGQTVDIRRIVSGFWLCKYWLKYKYWAYKTNDCHQPSSSRREVLIFCRYDFWETSLDKKLIYIYVFSKFWYVDKVEQGNQKNKLYFKMHHKMVR